MLAARDGTRILSAVAAGVLACLAAAVVPAIAADLGNEDCLSCHGDSVSKDEKHPANIAGGAFSASAHSDLQCTTCHADATSLPHGKLKEVDLETCTDCHDDEVKAYREGDHARARAAGVTAAPRCDGCHGDLHKVVDRSDDKSPEHWIALAQVCARCHADPNLARERNLSVVQPVEAYLESAHARAIREGKRGAVCSDCHDSHRTLPPDDPKSTIWRATVPQTCGKCHKDVVDTFQQSVHGQALARGMRDAPTCTDCHGEHRILSHTDSGSPVFAGNVSRDTCGRCHGDTRLVERHGLSDTNFSAFQDSFHGLAIRAGEVSAANCSSCHGVHDVLPASDPRSSVHPDNIAKTCARCHPGAGQRFAVGPVHVSATISKDGAQHWIRLIYLWIIAVVIGGMVLHTAADFVRKAAMQPATHAEARGPARLRMPLRLRLQHGLVMLSFPLLAYSGFALTTPESWWAAPLLHWETAHATRGITHRIAAIVLLVAVIWHVGNYFSKASRQREWMRGIWWKLSDARHFFAMLGWYVGLRREHPVSGRFSYIEKAEYWAFLWGIVLMAVTGLPLWFKDITLRYLPKWLTDVATSLHFYEAVLATLAILVWHMYWVVFDPDVYPMDMSWWHGRAPAARNAERIDDAEAAPPASPVAEAAVAAREDSGNRE